MHLAHHSSLKTRRQNEIEVLLERFRSDQYQLTSDVLKLNDGAALRHQKPLYNYGLLSIREKMENEQDLEQEHTYYKYRIDALKLIAERKHESKTNFSGMLKAERKRKFDKIY